MSDEAKLKLAPVGDLVPHGYWPKLMAQMKTWEKIPEFDFPDQAAEPAQSGAA